MKVTLDQMKPVRNIKHKSAVFPPFFCIFSLIASCQDLHTICTISLGDAESRNVLGFSLSFIFPEILAVENDVTIFGKCDPIVESWP